MENYREESHTPVIGYILWIFGFLGAHRFYYGRPITGTLYLFTLGLFFIGVIYDFWTLNEQIDLINNAS